jgi:hypothetical protein
MKLAQLQQQFQAYLLQGNNSLATIITDGPRLAASAKLEIYLNAYQLRLQEALHSEFPKTQVLMGAQDFNQLCASYIARYPSQSASLTQLGQHFSTFLSSAALTSQRGFLSEMADFEWQLMQAMQASDAPTLSVTELSNIAPEHWGHLSFTFHPSVRLRHYHWSVPKLWKAIEDNASPFAPRPQRLTWLIWRQEIECYFESCSDTAKIIAEGILQGQCFAELAESLCESLDPANAAQTLLQQLQYWFKRGLITGLTL